MNLWGHRFSQNANQKLQGFLPYQTNKDCSTFFGDFLVSVGSFFGYNSCLFGRAEICKKFGWHLGRNNDLINSLTFRYVTFNLQLRKVLVHILGRLPFEWQLFDKRWRQYRFEHWMEEHNLKSKDRVRISVTFSKTGYLKKRQTDFAT